jgi:uncharacterized protein YukE
MADEIQVDPESLVALSKKIGAEATSLSNIASGMNTTVKSLSWDVSERASVNANTDSLIARATEAYNAMLELAQSLMQTAYAFGYVDNSEYWITRHDQPTDSTHEPEPFTWESFQEFLDGTGFWVDLAEAVGTVGAMQLIRMSYLAGEITEVAGSAALKNVGDSGAIGVLGKVGLGIGIAVATIETGFRISDDLDRYDGDSYEQGSAVGIDVVEGVASVAIPMAASWYVGGMIGASVGSVVPGAGTAVGFLVGVAVGIAVGYAISEFDDSELKEDMVEGVADATEWTVDTASDAGGAVADAAVSVGSAISDFCDDLW